MTFEELAGIELTPEGKIGETSKAKLQAASLSDVIGHMDVLEGVRELLTGFNPTHEALKTIPQVLTMKQLFRCFKAIASCESDDDSWAIFDPATMTQQDRCDAMSKIAQCLGIVDSCVVDLDSTRNCNTALGAMQQWRSQVRDK
eukprot:626604-Prorocentrum_lima.AAC.1